jgi:hypothetical protein
MCGGTKHARDTYDPRYQLLGGFYVGKIDACSAEIELPHVGLAACRGPLIYTVLYLYKLSGPSSSKPELAKFI